MSKLDIATFCMVHRIKKASVVALDETSVYLHSLSRSKRGSLMVVKYYYIALFLMMSIAVNAVEYHPERYNLIIERAPFGEEPVQVEETEDMRKQAVESAAAAASLSKLQKDMRLCFLLEGDDGEVRAGFQNLKAQEGDPKNIMLMLGESYKGMKLQKIDLKNDRASVVVNGRVISFTLKKSSAAIAPPAAQDSAQQPVRRFGGGFRKNKPVENTAGPELSPEEQARKREETRENLRQYQMEVIRAGMPPLPIPLTPEMDEQLVAEGVLPPVE